MCECCPCCGCECRDCVPDPFWIEKDRIRKEKEAEIERQRKIIMNDFIAEYCNEINTETSDLPLGEKEK